MQKVLKLFGYIKKIHYLCIVIQKSHTTMFSLKLRFENEKKESVIVEHQSDYIPRVGNAYHIIDKSGKAHYGKVKHVEYTASQKSIGGYEIIFVVLKSIIN